MAWLNLNHDLFQEESWIDCDMPFRSGMENDRHWWGYRGSERTKHGLNTWSFIEYVIEKNIDKPFSNAFRYFCKFVSRQYQSYFLERFRNYNSIGRGGYWEKYWIDEQDIIRAEPKRFGRWYWRDDEAHNMFRSFDFKEVWLMKLTKDIYEYNWKKKEYKWTVRIKYEDRTVYTKMDSRYLSPEGWTYTDGENHKAVQLKSSEGYKVENISPRSNRYKKLRAEDNKRYLKLQRENERKKKEVVYSFLTREEKELKEARKLDQYNLYRHGFNDESFKGKPYHGRKNKKQRREEARINARLHSEM